MSESKTTTDHDTIRRWAEERGGRPATVSATQNAAAGILRIDFEPEQAEGLSLISLFEKFDRENLVFLYQDRTREG